MKNAQSVALPTVLLIFGATGDLMGKKIIPSLWHLVERKQLPVGFEVIGISRRSLSAEEFRTLLVNLIEKYVGDVQDADRERFLKLFTFQRVTFENGDDFAALGKELSGRDEARGPANRLLYMAVPPEAFPQIFGHDAFGAIVTDGTNGKGKTGAIIEKPFGIDLKSAQALEEVLAKRFSEGQLYRADHYLAKPVLRNIPRFRFDDGRMEHLWNAEYVASIAIRTWEPLGVEMRGAFYDGLGTLRDVGQNHLLEMLALITMEKPESNDTEDVRNARAAALSLLRIPKEGAIRKNTFRAQYEGYPTIEGVRSGSTTETYYRLTAYLDSERWRSVPITMEAGKRLPRWRTEIIVSFKNGNEAAFIMRPEEKIVVTMAGERQEFSLHDTEKNVRQYVAEYARILMDASKGDRTLFVTKGEIENAWRFVDPIEDAWKKNVIPLAFYKPDTDEAIQVADKKWTEEI